MNRLLQGDVGSGKTVVALCALLTGIQGGYQGAFMAPTEVLAEQHFISVRSMLEGLEMPDTRRLGGDRAGGGGASHEPHRRAPSAPGRARGSPTVLSTSSSAPTLFSPTTSGSRRSVSR